MIVELQDLRGLDYCTPGIRLFAKKHDFDLRSFVHNGIDSKELEKFNDSMVNKVIENARLRHGQQ